MSIVDPSEKSFKYSSTNSQFSECNSKCRLGWKWRWKLLNGELTSSFDYLMTWLVFLSFIPWMTSHPIFSSQSDCDWSGRGTPSSSLSLSIQTASLRCSRGGIRWEDPKGGLRIHLSPHSLHPPFKLCLEDQAMTINDFQVRRHRILLEESSGRLLQILSSQLKNSNCYEIHSASIILYIESSSSNHNLDNQSIPSPKIISIAYELEPLQPGNEDECRPCSETEILKTFCSADVVARGEIVQIRPGSAYDWIYIKSDWILHQNHPVFSPYSPPLINFLESEPHERFDLDQPDKFTETQPGLAQFQGIIGYPSSCSASVGEGDFLWLINFRFGRPLAKCGIYWDSWVDLATRSQGDCPLSIGTNGSSEQKKTGPVGFHFY